MYDMFYINIIHLNNGWFIFHGNNFISYYNSSQTLAAMLNNKATIRVSFCRFTISCNALNFLGAFSLGLISEFHLDRSTSTYNCLLFIENTFCVCTTLSVTVDKNYLRSCECNWDFVWLLTRDSVAPANGDKRILRSNLVCANCKVRNSISASLMLTVNRYDVTSGCCWCHKKRRQSAPDWSTDGNKKRGSAAERPRGTRIT